MTFKLRAQSFVEYALLVLLLAVVVIAALVLTGQITGQDLGIGSNLSTTPTPSAAPTSTSSTNTQILQDMFSRTLSYYQQHNSWPRTTSPYNFTDIGLNPADYSQPINGLYWSPNGSNIAVTNKSGDNLQVYVKKTDGTLVHVLDDWSIFCDVSSTVCYYHNITPGHQVDFSSIVVTNG
jgi:Flp pilus assembly pilin Flp